MNQSCFFVVILLMCSVYLTASAPSPTIIGVGFGGIGYGGGFDDFGYSPVAGYGRGFYPDGYGYGYSLYNRPYGRRYRYPHFYPPIAVLAG